MPCIFISHTKFLCTKNIRWSTAAGYLHVQVELIVGLLIRRVLAQAGREFWQLHSVASCGNHIQLLPLMTSKRLLSQASMKCDTTLSCKMQCSRSYVTGETQKHVPERKMKFSVSLLHQS